MPLLTSDRRAVALIRPVKGLPEEVQIEMAREYGIDDRDMYIHGQLYGRDARDEWIRALGTDRSVVGWIARADVLIKRRAELPAKTRPSIDYMTAVTMATAKAREIIEAVTKTSSTQARQWAARVEWGAKQASAGVPKDRQAQVEHGRRGGEIIKARSTVAKWTNELWTERREDLLPYWRDRRHDWKTARAKLAKKSKDLGMLGYHSLWRIFGPRGS